MYLVSTNLLRPSGREPKAPRRWDNYGLLHSRIPGPNDSCIGLCRRNLSMAFDEDAQSLSSKSPAERQYGTSIDRYGNEFQVRKFTIKELRNAIPPHCFERSALRGFAYVARDILLLASTFTFSTTMLRPITYLGHFPFLSMNHLYLRSRAFCCGSVGDGSRMWPSVLFDIEDLE